MNTWKLQPMLNESKKHALAVDFMDKFELSLFDDETRWDDSGKLNCDICKTCYHSNDETELRAHFNINIEDN